MVGRLVGLKKGRVEFVHLSVEVLWRVCKGLWGLGCGAWAVGRGRRVLEPGWVLAIEFTAWGAPSAEQLLEGAPAQSS